MPQLVPLYLIVLFLLIIIALFLVTLHTNRAKIIARKYSTIYFFYFIVVVAFKIPLNGILVICNLDLMYPVIAAISSCLTCILLKCYYKKEYFCIKDLISIFLMTFILCFFIWMVKYNIDLSPILEILLLPFLITLSVEVTPEGFRTLTLNMNESNTSSSSNPSSGSSAGGPAPSGGNTSSGSLDVAQAAHLVNDSITELRKVANQLQYLTNQIILLKGKHDVKVMQNSNGFISLDVPGNMGNEEGEKLAKRVFVIATAFEDQCETFESIAKIGLDRKQVAVNLGARPNAGINQLLVLRISDLDKIKKEYRDTLTFQD